ncbi:hypothetical protein [Marinicauda pacifica]|uniref:hypothetical protein n=1 Tax=Marinicauda pacifica TaxID=1133559 RepID=UPI001305450E|nr:hypothetical protein [Marinicauda pacifica]
MALGALTLSCAWVHPVLSAVIKYTDKGPARYRERFEAGAVFWNLMIDGELE